MSKYPHPVKHMLGLTRTRVKIFVRFRSEVLRLTMVVQRLHFLTSITQVSKCIDVDSGHSPLHVAADRVILFS